MISQPNQKIIENPQNKTKNKAENKTESKTESKAENKTESKTQSKTDIKTEIKTESKAENKTGTNPLKVSTVEPYIPPYKKQQKISDIANQTLKKQPNRKQPLGEQMKKSTTLTPRQSDDRTYPKQLYKNVSYENLRQHSTSFQQRNPTSAKLQDKKEQFKTNSSTNYYAEYLDQQIRELKKINLQLMASLNKQTTIKQSTMKKNSELELLIKKQKQKNENLEKKMTLLDQKSLSQMAKLKDSSQKELKSLKNDYEQKLQNQRKRVDKLQKIQREGLQSEFNKRKQLIYKLNQEKDQINTTFKLKEEQCANKYEKLAKQYQAFKENSQKQRINLAKQSQLKLNQKIKSKQKDFLVQQKSLKAQIQKLQKQKLTFDTKIQEEKNQLMQKHQISIEKIKNECQQQLKKKSNFISQLATKNQENSEKFKQELNNVKEIHEKSLIQLEGKYKKQKGELINSHNLILARELELRYKQNTAIINQITVKNEKEISKLKNQIQVLKSVYKIDVEDLYKRKQNQIVQQISQSQSISSNSSAINKQGPCESCSINANKLQLSKDSAKRFYGIIERLNNRLLEVQEQKRQTKKQHEHLIDQIKKLQDKNQKLQQQLRQIQKQTVTQQKHNEQKWQKILQAEQLKIKQSISSLQASNAQINELQQTIKRNEDTILSLQLQNGQQKQKFIKEIYAKCSQGKILGLLEFLQKMVHEQQDSLISHELMKKFDKMMAINRKQLKKVEVLKELFKQPIERQDQE